MTKDKKTPWQLDHRLQADTILLNEQEDSVLLLMNDSRWLWLILVPKKPNAEELHDFSQAEQAHYLTSAAALGQVLKNFAKAEKVNIAALGNMVRQLHIHILVRHEDDANWPDPVWGFGGKKLYEKEQVNQLVKQLKEKIPDALFTS